MRPSATRTGTDLPRPAIVAGSVVLLVVVVVALWQVKWISDDGYIYLSYVRMFAEHGELAFNTAENVDAATGFLWLLALVVADQLTPFWTPVQACLVLSLTLALTACGLVLARDPGPLAIATAAALFAPRFMQDFATSGLETPMILFLLVALHQSRAPPVRAVICGVLPFVRPELVLVSTVYLLPPLRRRDLAAPVLALSVALALCAWRYAVFGNVLPNTTFAKLGHQSYGSGWNYSLEFARTYPLMVLLLGLLLLGALRLRQLDGPEGRTRLPLVAAAVLTGAVILLGGDFMHGRFFLAPYVLTVLALADIYRTAMPSLDRQQTRRVVILFTALPFAGLLGNGGAFDDGRLMWRGVVDERHIYERRNPSLSEWSGLNSHPWAEGGRALAGLQQELDRPVGFPYPWVGQLRYFSAQSDVYVLDQLSLAQVPGTLMDQHGRPDRMGHAAELPYEVLYMLPRVTLFEPPDAELERLLSFEYDGFSLILGELSQVDLYQRAGLLPPGTAERVEARIAEILSAPEIDTLTLFYLKHRYAGPKETRARINTLYEQARQVPYSYPWWYERIRDPLAEALRINDGEIAALPARYRMMLAAGSSKPIPRRFAFRRHVDLSGPSCELPVTTWEGGSIEATDFRINPGAARLFLSLDAIGDACGPDRTRVQILVQPVKVTDRPVKEFRLLPDGAPVAIYGSGGHAQPETTLDLRQIGDGVTLEFNTGAEGATTFEITAIAF